MIKKWNRKHLILKKKKEACIPEYVFMGELEKVSEHGWKGDYYFAPEGECSVRLMADTRSMARAKIQEELRNKHDHNPPYRRIEISWSDRHLYTDCECDICQRRIDGIHINRPDDDKH